MKRKILSLLIVFSLVFSLFVPSTFASTNKEFSDNNKITTYVRAVGENGTEVPFTKVTLDSKALPTYASYGMQSSPSEVDYVTPMHSLLAAMKERGMKDKISQFDIGDNGWINDMFGWGTEQLWVKNGTDLPELSPAYKSQEGDIYTFFNSPLGNNGYTGYGFFGEFTDPIKGSYSTKAAKETWTKDTNIGVPVTLKYLTTGSLFKHPDTDENYGVCYDGNGNYTKVFVGKDGKEFTTEADQRKDIKVNNDGTFSLTFDKAGTYVVAARWYNSDDELIASEAYCKVTVHDSDQDAAAKVDAAIENIGEVTLESETTLQAIWESYNALSDEAKKKVTKLDKLKAAQAKLDKLKENKPTTGKVSDNPFNYSQFLGNEGLRGVYDSKTPRTASELEVKWTKKTGDTWNDVPGCPIIVGDYIYSYSSEYLRKLDLLTGEEVGKVKVFGKSTNQFFIHLCYADGKIFVPLKTNNMGDNPNVKKAYLRVFDAETLEQLYITDDILYGDMQTPLMYHDGHVVTAGYFGKGKASYACFTTEDEDPSTPNEVKKAKWSVPCEEKFGFSWNGAVFNGENVYFAEGGDKKPSTVWGVNYKTGNIIEKFSLPDGYHSKSTLVYNEKNNCIYIPSNNKDGGASIRSYEVNANGTLNQNTVKEWKSGTSGGGTQSTPIIYNDRIYLGGGGGTMGSAEPFHVIDANTMETIYSIDGLKTKGSAAISTAYATKENGNQVYIYMVPYNCTGDDSFWIISDKEGQTEPKYETMKIGGDYCSQTVAIAPNGYMVWYQDEKNLYVCGRKDSATASAITGEDVNAQISRLDDPETLAYYNSVEIQRIEARYNALSDAEKQKVTEYNKLLKIKEVMELGGTNKVERLNSGIASLPNEITLEDREKVQMLLKAYNSLSKEEQAKVKNKEKLFAAQDKIDSLLMDGKITKLENAINQLPKIDQLVSADKGKVNKLVSDYNALPEIYQKKVKNSKMLFAAQNKIAAIEKQMQEVKNLIREKLEGKKITLSSKADIKAIDEKMKGLNPEDIALISEVEQFLSPAKVDLVNLMINELIKTPINKENKNTIKELIQDIEDFYAGILKDDLKYVKNYDQVAKIKSDIEKISVDKVQSGKTPVDKSPKTGDETNLYLWILILSVASVFVHKLKVKEEKQRDEYN